MSIRNKLQRLSIHKFFYFFIYFGKIKQYTYNFNDKNSSDNIYTLKKLHSYIVINIGILLIDHQPLSYVKCQNLACIINSLKTFPSPRCNS